MKSNHLVKLQDAFKLRRGAPKPVALAVALRLGAN
jgi:hypothetical protein